MTERRDEALRPCPFCGFQPSMDDGDAVYPDDRERTLWAVHCYESGGGCGAQSFGGSRGEALANWNRRASLSATAPQPARQRSEDEIRNTKAGDWLPLLEMFSPKEVLLHGAAGEDAMSVGDVVALVRALAIHQQAAPLSETPAPLGQVVAIRRQAFLEASALCVSGTDAATMLRMANAPSTAGNEEPK